MAFRVLSNVSLRSAAAGSSLSLHPRTASVLLRALHTNSSSPAAQSDAHTVVPSFLPSLSSSSSSSRHAKRPLSPLVNSPVMRLLHMNGSPVRKSSPDTETAATLNAPYAAEVTAEETTVTKSQEKTAFGTWVDRMLSTVEITVSKIFPAGFGWQAAAVYSDSLGYGPTSPFFYVLTGVGDGLAVGACHFLWNVGKRAIVNTSNKHFGTKWAVPELKSEAVVSLWLTSASFCSGSMWQPILNGFQSMELPFSQCVTFTGLACASCFYFGLRIGRYVYGPHFAALPLASRDNIYDDFRLSLGIGGAAGLFVGTDVSFVHNPFKEYIGVFPDTAPLEGMQRAGLSTALGFMAMQTVQNTGGALFFRPARSLK